jgi:hypothetical protein
MASSKPSQFTDFTVDILGRYMCNGLDEALQSKDLPNAIIGNPNAQVGRDLVDFPDIVKVADVAALRTMETMNKKFRWTDRSKINVNQNLITDQLLEELCKNL